MSIKILRFRKKSVNIDFERRNRMSFFSKNLEYLRKSKYMSRSELAEKLNVNQSTISRWENEDMGVTVDNAYDVAQFFNVSMADLTGVDLTIKNSPPISKLDVLFNKTKNILNDDERAMIEATMERAIKKYEEEKNKNGDI